MARLLPFFALLGMMITCKSVAGQQKNYDTTNQCGHASYDCVPYFQCVDGEINTDGSGLIDKRIQPQSVCENPEYPEVPAVCCLIPGAEPTPTPVETCPGYQECVSFSLCSNEGNIITDGTGIINIRTGYTSCYLETGIGGICCSPPPPYVDTCPGNSVCTLGSDCFGQALDASSNFIDYIQTGLWTTCSYGTGDGVCCINPFVKPVLKAATHCGVRNYDIDSRIASGSEAKFGEFPWQSIIFYQNYTFNCGASLISNKHVITAAHCIDGLLASDIRIRFGEWQVNSFDEELPYVDRNVYATYIHPKFNPKNLHNDVAVMELIEPLVFNYHINSICLPKYGKIFDPYTPCFAGGWGKDSFQGSFQHILKKISVPFIDHDTCQSLLRKTRLGRYFRLDQSFVCAGGEENKDACYGDGGGPLVCKDTATSNYVLAGITSWGIGCGAKNVPGVYVDVQKMSTWIEGIVGGQAKAGK